MKKNNKKWYRNEERRKNIMKKLIGVVVASMMFANIGLAEMRLIEDQRLKGKHFNYIPATFCIDGYKFVMFTGTTGKSMVQFMRQNKVSGAAYPVKC